MNADHPQPEVLADWALDPNSETVDAGARAHLESGCAICAQRVNEIRNLAEQTRRAIETGAPAAVVERAYGALQSTGLSDVEILVASLVEDTRQLAGVRDEAVADRFLLFRAGAWDVQVRISPRDGDQKARILGHIEGPDDRSLEGLDVRVLHGERVLASCRTDDLGEFAVESRIPCPLFMELEGSRFLIRTPPVR